MIKLPFNSKLPWKPFHPTVYKNVFTFDIFQFGYEEKDSLHTSYLTTDYQSSENSRTVHLDRENPDVDKAIHEYLENEQKYLKADIIRFNKRISRYCFITDDFTDLGLY